MSASTQTWAIVTLPSAVDAVQPAAELAGMPPLARKSQAALASTTPVEGLSSAVQALNWAAVRVIVPTL